MSSMCGAAMTLLCIAPRCALPRRHTNGCGGEQCRGCLPAVATVGRLCERCYQRADATLVDIGELYDRLLAGEPDVRDGRTYLAPELDDDGQPTGWLLIKPRDPVANGNPAGPVSGSGQPRVSGTPDPSSPISLDIHDLLAPARLGAVHDEWHDQTGQPSVAAVLETWARDWAEIATERLPDPGVGATLRWLRARLEWAAKHHLAMDEFIGEMRSLHGRLITVLRERDPAPELCHGVPCRKCDERNLWRRPDGSGDVDCHSCGLIYRPDEYDRWVRMVAATTRRMALAE